MQLREIVDESISKNNQMLLEKLKEYQGMVMEKQKELDAERRARKLISELLEQEKNRNACLKKELEDRDMKVYIHLLYEALQDQSMAVPITVHMALGYILAVPYIN